MAATIVSTSIGAGVRANESYRTPVVRPESGAECGSAGRPLCRSGPYEEFAGRHTIMYPLWALVASDWERAYGWCGADQAAQLEAYLKQCYKQQHDNNLPALVQR